MPCYIPVPVKRGTGNQIEKRRQKNERQTDASGETFFRFEQVGRIGAGGAPAYRTDGKGQPPTD